MKRLLLVTMLMLTMLLAACGGASDGDNTGDATDMAAEGGDTCMGIAVEPDATVVFSGWGDETEQQVYRDSITRFNEACPSVTIDYQPVPADFQTQIKAAFAGGDAPDVIYVDDSLMTALGRTGQLLALDDFMASADITREEFVPALLDIFTVDGKTYALPKDWGTLGLVYLPEAFAEAGIDEPTADWTWEDLRTAAQALAENTEYGGFCQGADWARFAPWAFSYGATFTNDDWTSATLDNEGIETAAQIVADMKQEGSLVTAADVGAGWCGEAIGKKLVATTLEGGWMVNFMRNDFADVEWKAVPVPSGPEGKADIIFTNGIGVNAQSDNPNAAAAFALFVTGRDNQAAIAETGFAYPARSDQLDLIKDENDKAISEGGTYELTRVANWGPNTGRVNDAVGKALERIYLGEQTVSEAFTQAQGEAQQALDDAQ
ncbi:MAG: extracellular solute-binding protein [Anaerolineales bacterium]|nr:extracellular solute-binding protein [Anaerolineales bacterium]MCB9126623.1 extracellular solute-binding protein [Ardenticatenales bacterium]